MRDQTLREVPHAFGKPGPGMAFVSLFKFFGRRVWHIERFGAAGSPYWMMSLCGREDREPCPDLKDGFCLPDWPGLGDALRTLNIGAPQSEEWLCRKCRDAWLAGYGAKCVEVPL